MNKFSFISIAFAFGLTACGASATTPESTTTTEMVTTTTEYVITQADKDLLFMEEITRVYPSFVSSLGKVTLIEVGTSLCSDIDNGLTIDQLVANIGSAGLGQWAGEFGYTFGVAIRVYCPENQWFIDSLR
jgi:hypothetical protein